MGRAAGGVRAMRLGKNDRVVGAVALRRTDTTILVATEKGFGKRSETEEYRISHRGGKGIFTVKTADKTGRMVAIKEIKEKDDVVIVTDRGVVIRQHASDIRVAGRNTQGVRLIKLDAGDAVSDVAAVPADEDEESVNGNGAKADAQEDEPSDQAQIGLFEGAKTPAKPAGKEKLKGADAPAAGRKSGGKGKPTTPGSAAPKPPEPAKKRTAKQKPKGRR